MGTDGRKYEFPVRPCLAKFRLIEDAAGPFKPTPKHAQDARLLLMYHLPRELADRVLDDAEYWPSFTTSTECKLEIASPQGSDSEWSYLVTPPLLDPSSQKMDVISPQDGGAGAPKVKGIRFAVVSHDQGSSWDRENHSTNDPQSTPCGYLHTYSSLRRNVQGVVDVVRGLHLALQDRPISEDRPRHDGGSVQLPAVQRWRACEGSADTRHCGYAEVACAA